MEGQDTSLIHPQLTIPRQCSTLDLESNNGECINVRITSNDIHGNPIDIYSGLCNVRFMDANQNDINEEINEVPIVDEYGQEITVFDDDNVKLHYVKDLDADIIETIGSSPLSVIEDNYIVDPLFSQTQQMWVDARRVTNVINTIQTKKTVEIHTITEQPTMSDVPVVFSEENERRHNAILNCHDFDTNHFHLYEEEAQLGYSDIFSNVNDIDVVAEEIVTEDTSSNTPSHYEIMNISDFDEHDALKQLMSPKTMNTQKQSKTIVYEAGQDNNGQTIQKIAINDPSVKCRGKKAKEVILPGNSTSSSQWKYYQCEHCKTLFDDMTAFRKHIKAHTKRHVEPSTSRATFNYVCQVCGTKLRSQKKIDLHAAGHGNPELECNVCLKVFATKFILRNHYKIHSAIHSCKFCRKRFDYMKDLKEHLNKKHSLYLCDECEYFAQSYVDLTVHLEAHAAKKDEEAKIKNKNVLNLSKDKDQKSQVKENKHIDEAGIEVADINGEKDKSDSILAKVMTNKEFLHNINHNCKKHVKTCEVCMKQFDRASGLKRHLIEHVVRSTLAKTPVASDGTLDILCEVCRSASFKDIVNYKAHLRMHAKLTMYQCNVCNKSFSDSSNFSKHKKIHGGDSFYQCDLCSRKFYSKRMITLHMDHHTKNKPVKCKHCDKQFHFESNLNKHIRSVHAKEDIRFRCRFCSDSFHSLRLKWEHEWTTHNVRKIVIDCSVCGEKFRKFSELRKHRATEHEE